MAASSREKAFQLFDQSVEMALRLEYPVVRYETLLDIANQMAGVGEKERALATLKRAATSCSLTPVAL